MLPRVLEPEVMDCVEEARDYDAMDHSEVNRLFVDDLLRELGGAASETIRVLDVGTGTALIPIELCRRSPQFHVTGVDLAEAMLALGRHNITAAGLDRQILLEQIDAKRLPFGDGHFDVVMSNSIVHHIPEPRQAFGEMWRVLRAGGLLFVRDLLRPDNRTTLDQLVATYAADCNPHQRQMFRDSLHAALNLDELRELLRQLGIATGWVRQTSDRHWTVCGRK